MKRNVTFLIALAILVVSGLVHGSWAERWNLSTVLEDAAARVDDVPMEIGDWKAEALETDAAAFFQAGALKFWTRSYSNARGPSPLVVILMCGRAGRMSVHTPEVCYRGAGYEMGENPEVSAMKADLGEDLGTFWTARFSKQGGAASDLRLYWSWNAEGTWQAEANPRWEFGGKPFLYKLYLSQSAPGSARAAHEAAQEFLRQFLPELDKTLFKKSL